MSKLSNNNKYLLASVTSGILFWISWPPLPFFVFLFIAFIPLLWMEAHITKHSPSRSRLKIFLFSYLGFVIWNGSTTWWLWNASPPGSVFASLANAAFMATIFLLYHITKSHMGKNWGYLSLIMYWLSFEFLHHRWELAWTWLSLGNGLAKFPVLIQWYEYSGIMGGSLWILMINIFLFDVIRLSVLNRKQKVEDITNKARTFRLYIIYIITLLIIGIPTLVSVWIYSTYKLSDHAVEVVIVQPNIDPHNEKFPSDKRFIPFEIQLERLLNLSAEKLTPETQYLVWPETAIPGGIDVEKLDNSNQIIKISEFLSGYPQLTLITGIDGYMIYGEEKKSVTARYSPNSNIYYDYFNSAIQIGDKIHPEYYHKSKLVPGVERMPYPELFSYLERFTINIGGISGSLGLQKERTVFFNQDSIGIAPVICFESVFGDYVTDYVKNGAEGIFIITNDGWWGNTAGYKQHLSFSTLRAIETRKSIARSANTGISCFINERGDIRMHTEYWEPAVIRDKITLNKKHTFYTRYGDLTGRVGLLIAIICLLVTFVSSRTNRFFFRVKKPLTSQ